MKTLIRLVIGLLVLGLSLAAASYMLPGSYHVTRSIEIRASADVVFAQVNDLKQWQAWTIWSSKDPLMKYETSPVSAGQGAWQKWDGPESGSGELTLTASEAPRRVAYALYFPDFESRSTGEILIEPRDGGVLKVTWTNGGALGKNPIMRWFGLLFDRMIGGDFLAGLERLKAACEKTTPVPAAAPEASAAVQ